MFKDNKKFLKDDTLGLAQITVLFLWSGDLYQTFYYKNICM